MSLGAPLTVPRKNASTFLRSAIDGLTARFRRLKNAWVGLARRRLSYAWISRPLGRQATNAARELAQRRRTDLEVAVRYVRPTNSKPQSIAWAAVAALLTRPVKRLRPRATVKKYCIISSSPPLPYSLHLLGNIWSQEWNIFPTSVDAPKSPQRYNLTKISARTEKPIARHVQIRREFSFLLRSSLLRLLQTFLGTLVVHQAQPTRCRLPASAWDLRRKRRRTHQSASTWMRRISVAVHHELVHTTVYARAIKIPPLFQNALTMDSTSPSVTHQLAHPHPNTSTDRPDRSRSAAFR